MLKQTGSHSAQPILRGINFVLRKGEVRAVVGASASGKSTLARALVGVWPAIGGPVRLDAEISQWTRDALGTRLGYLPQDIELFDGSIADNIDRFGEQDAKQIIAASRHAGIHDMILHFALGYDTPLGPGGLGLSGGQKQRLGLARALYGNPSLIALDEPNSNLEEAGESALISAITALKAAGGIVVLITHRPGILAVVDHIPVLKDGGQQAFGPQDPMLKALLPQAWGGEGGGRRCVTSTPARTRPATTS